MMLVMTTTGIFDGCHSNLINATWSKLNEFVPQLQTELNPAVPSSSEEQQLGPKVDKQPSAEEVAATEQKATNNGEVTIFLSYIIELSRCLKCCHSSTVTLTEPCTRCYQLTMMYL